MRKIKRSQGKPIAYTATPIVTKKLYTNNQAIYLTRIQHATQSLLMKMSKDNGMHKIWWKKKKTQPPSIQGEALQF